MLDYSAISSTYHEMLLPWQEAFGAISLAPDVSEQEKSNGGKGAG